MKTKEPSPDLFRVIYRPGRWKIKSERHFVAFTVDEALVDFYHVFLSGHVHAKYIKIFDVEQYNRFADRWEDVTDQITRVPKSDKNITWKKRPNTSS